MIGFQESLHCAADEEILCRGDGTAVCVCVCVRAEGSVRSVRVWETGPAQPGPGSAFVVQSQRGSEAGNVQKFRNAVAA